MKTASCRPSSPPSAAISTTSSCRTRQGGGSRGLWPCCRTSTSRCRRRSTTICRCEAWSEGRNSETVSAVREERQVTSRPTMCRLRRLALLLLHELCRALLEFSRRDVLDMRADVPLIAGWILHAATAVAIELICRLHHRCAPGLDRLLVDGIDIGHVKIEHGGGSLGALRGVGNHHNRIADLEFRVHYLAVRPHHRLEYGLGAEGLLHETDDLLGTVDDEIRRDGVIAVGNRLYFCCHGELLWLLKASLLTRNRTFRSAGCSPIP